MATILDYIPSDERLQEHLRESLLALVCTKEPQAILSYFEVEEFVPPESSILDLPLLRHSIETGDSVAATLHCLNDVAMDGDGLLTSDRPAILVNGSYWTSDAQFRRTCRSLESEPVALASQSNGDCVETTQPFIPSINAVIDTESPIAVALCNDAEGFAPVDKTYVSQITKELCSSYSRIEKCWPKMASFLRSRIRLFVFAEKRIGGGDLGVRRGASFPEYPGVIFMGNYHREDTIVDTYCENIVHEATHNGLFDLEQFDKWYEPKEVERLDALTVPSLFSDRKLPFYSFYHSLIVFASLHEWFSRWEKSDPTSHSERKLMFIRNGFRNLKNEYYREILNAKNLSPSGQILLESLVYPIVER